MAAPLVAPHTADHDFLEIAAPQTVDVPSPVAPAPMIAVPAVPTIVPSEAMPPEEFRQIVSAEESDDPLDEFDEDDFDDDFDDDFEDEDDDGYNSEYEDTDKVDEADDDADIDEFDEEFDDEEDGEGEEKAPEEEKEADKGKKKK